MSIYIVTFVIIYVVFCCVTAKGADVTLECPRKWRHKCPTAMSGTLQTTNFNPTVCSVFFNKIADFKFQKNGSTVVSTTCAVDFSTSCDGTSNNQGCACVSLVGNLYTFRYNLVIIDSVHAYGSWYCEPQCLDMSILLPLSTSRGNTCSFVQINYFILECRGIVLISVGTALVIVGVITLIAGCLGIAGYVVTVVGCIGYILLIAGSALMTVAYTDDEPAGIAFLWIGSVLLIILGIDILITGHPGRAQQKHIKANSASKQEGTELNETPRFDGDQQPEGSGGNHASQTENDASTSAANKKKDPCLKRHFSVLAKVGTGLMLVGGTLAIIGGIVAATEPCPSDDFPTTLQEIIGLVLAVIGFVVFFVGIIIGIVALKEEKNKTGSS